MNKIQKRRLYYVTISAITLSIATSLILYALKKNMNVFVTPSQLRSQHFSNEDHFRLGGIVKKNSVAREKSSLKVHFIITDLKQETAVDYEGILPDLFREEKGVIAEGSLNEHGVFIATQVLAKHDENYMPKKVYQALREGAQ